MEVNYILSAPYVAATTSTYTSSSNLLTLKIIEGKFLHDMDAIGKMDPYIVIEYGN